MPPTTPPEPEDYRSAGLPWFDYFDDRAVIRGAKALASLKSFKNGNESVNFSPERIIEIRKQRGLEPHHIRIRDNN